MILDADLVIQSIQTAHEPFTYHATSNGSGLA